MILFLLGMVAGALALAGVWLYLVARGADCEGP